MQSGSPPMRIGFALLHSASCERVVIPVASAKAVLTTNSMVSDPGVASSRVSPSGPASSLASAWDVARSTSSSGSASGPFTAVFSASAKGPTNWGTTSTLPAAIAGRKSALVPATVSWVWKPASRSALP